MKLLEHVADGLLDLTVLAETLLIDTDGIYDPRSLNDRLLLGLKGSMAEFELGLLRQRARAAFEQKVKRGFTLWEVPVGFSLRGGPHRKDAKCAQISQMMPISIVAGQS
jgi:DNA invertase Pin-like site-specific DNA recombinase